MTVQEALKSFGMLDTDEEVHSYAEELLPAFDLYAQSKAEEYNKISDQFLSYLDKEIDKAHKHAFFRTGYPEEAEWYRFEGALVNIKEKFLSLLNNQLNESKA